VKLWAKLGKTISHNCLKARSSGRRLEPEGVFGGDSDVVAGRWMPVTLLSFPRYVDGVQIIDEGTKWIRLWVISGNNRIYFQFDFE